MLSQKGCEQAVEIFTPLDPAMLSDPYAVYARLRETDPVHWHEGLRAWVLTRHDDCVEVLRQHEKFSSDPRKLGKPIADTVISLQTMDPPEQSLLRHRFLAALKRQDLDAWAGHVRARAAQLLAQVDGRPFDFVSEIAEPLSLYAMCQLYGVPYPREDEQLRNASRTMVLGMDSGLDPTRRQPALDARDVLNQFVEEWIAKPNGTGIVADIDWTPASTSTPTPDSERRYLVNSARAVFDAGYSVTSNFLGNVMDWLVSQGPVDRDVARRMDRCAVEELARLVGVVQAVSRHCLTDVQMRDQPIRRGEVVIVVLAGANHDPDVFPDPRKADLTRTPNPHVGFGRGVHSCIGGHLAVQAALALFQALSERPGSIQYDGLRTIRPTATQRGLDALRLRSG
jgi:cytochrome P450